jgi:hypothetical protein
LAFSFLFPIFVKKTTNMAHNPVFYWTGEHMKDAILINKPHIIQEGQKEDRIKSTVELLRLLEDYKEFSLNDVFDIQNQLLKDNNWRGIKLGFRKHNVGFDDTPDYMLVEEQAKNLFPVKISDKEGLLKWYKDIQTVHPLSDLNGRTFGIVVSVLYRNYLKEKGEI